MQLGGKIGQAVIESHVLEIANRQVLVQLGLRGILPDFPQEPRQHRRQLGLRNIRRIHPRVADDARAGIHHAYHQAISPGDSGLRSQEKPLRFQ